MKRAIQSLIATAALAAGAMTTAHALTPPLVQVQHAGIAVGEPYPGRHDTGRYDDRYDRHDRYDHDGRGDRRVSCRAPRWDPQQRYMPGQAVRHQGKFYVATRLSARVYNVNSPPEWTPNYWTRARCA